jgi:plasmid stabilization system protein ParE
MTEIVWSEPASHDFRRLVAFVRQHHSPNIAMRRIIQISTACRWAMNTPRLWASKIPEVD